MWIDIKNKKPKKQGAYLCFGIVNKGTEYENRSKFTAHWQGEQYGWSDKEGEDLIGINESVEFWFDFDEVQTPTIF